MKVAVTSTGHGLDSAVDPRFGRAAHFVVVETTSGAFAVVDNAQDLNAVQGAGIQAARIVSEAGAEEVLTGHVGPKAFAAMTAARIHVYTEAQGTVSEAIGQFTSGQLQVSDGANMDGHWC